MAEVKDKAKRSKGGVRRPRSAAQTWSYVLDIGLQDAQRCNECGKRQWVGAVRLETCPCCGGPLRSTKERRKVEQSGYPTEKAAKNARAAAVTKLARGNYRPPERITLAGYLRDVWLPEMRADGLKTTTRQSYERHVAEHLIGPVEEPFSLGLLELSGVTNEAIKEHYVALSEGYPAERKETDPETKEVKTHIVRRSGLAESSLRRIHATLHRALNIAVEKRLLDANPARGAGRKLPKTAKTRSSGVHHWEPTELARFLSFVETMPEERRAFYPLWYLLANTGLRRAEVAALRWEDFDAENKALRVERSRVPLKDGSVEETSPKTKGSARTVDLDARTVKVLDKRQRKAQKRAHLLAGPKWSDTGYIFTDAAGQPLHPYAISWQFRFAIEAANKDAADPETPKAVKLSPLSVHGLRHTHASLALQAGIPVTVVSKRLGHASVTMTLNVYSHALRDAQAECAEAVAAVIQQGGFTSR